MSLTVEKIHKLRDKSFTTLYDDHKQKWQEMVKKAKEYVKTYVQAGDKVRPGDVAEALQNAIKIDPDFENYVKNNSLPQKYWVTYFSEYVLDKVYPAQTIT